MDRREFIGLLATGFAGSTMLSSQSFAASQPASVADDRVIVFINLSGGCDGLNMITPLGQYDQLAQYRANVIVPKNRLLTLDSNMGMHPSMTQMHSLFQAGELAVVQGVSYPTPNMSHFRSKEIVWSGSSSGSFFETGWMGRQLENEHPDFPTNYPSSTNPDPLVLSFQSNPTATAQGGNGNFSTVTSDASKIADFQEDTYSQYGLSDGRYDDEMDFLRTQMELTVKYNQAVTDRYDMGPVVEDTGGMSKDFASIVRLLKAGSKTKMFIIDQPGYDTHGGQVIEGDATLGVHADLLGELSDNIGKFMDDLKTHGLQDRVVGLVSTEFGRRIMSNDSYGTDHGYGAPWLVFGSQVKGGVIGHSELIPDVVDDATNVEMQYDYRNIYQTLLRNWFEVPSPAVSASYENIYQEVPLFDSSMSILKPNFEDEFNLKIDPTGTILRLESSRNQSGVVRVLDHRGRLRYQTRVSLVQGVNTVQMKYRDLSAGRYVFQISTSEIQFSKSQLIR